PAFIIIPPLCPMPPTAKRRWPIGWPQDDHRIASGAARVTGRHAGLMRRSHAEKKDAAVWLATRHPPGPKWDRGAPPSSGLPEFGIKKRAGRAGPTCVGGGVGSWWMSVVGIAWIGTHSGRLPAGIPSLVPRVFHRTLIALALIAPLAPGAARA